MSIQWMIGVDKRTINVADLIENQPLGRVHFVTLLLCFLALFIEGIDFSAASFAAPRLLKEWHTEQSAIGLIFGAGSFGMVAGAMLLGLAGDRWGRRRAIVLAVLAYSVPTLAAVFASTARQLVALRFLAGLGMGGILPVTIALLTELAPRRFRLSFAATALVGPGSGGLAASLVAVWLIPRFGWPIAFLVPGLFGTALCGALFLFLPESIRYLTLTAPASSELRQLLAQLVPRLEAADDVRFSLPHQSQGRAFSFRLLFSDGLCVKTLSFWLGALGTQLFFVTLIVWLPVLLEKQGLSPLQASVAVSYGAASGLFTQVVLARLLDFFGPVVPAVVALIATMAVIALGMAAAPDGTTTIMTAVAIACAAGATNAFGALIGYFYPTSIRANGVGSAKTIGNLGGVLGPVIVGYLLSAGLPSQQVFYLIATPFLVIAPVCAVLARIYNRDVAANTLGDSRAELVVDRTMCFGNSEPWLSGGLDRTGREP